MSRKPPKPARFKLREEAKVAIVAARFNEEIVNELLKRCRKRLWTRGVKASDMEVYRVPGAFELPFAAHLAAMSERFSAVICLGAVIRGETPHFDFVAGEAARGIQRVALDTRVPVIFGVLTTNTEKQARERLGAGERAADAALEMIQFVKSIEAT
jgi:6,7-dimethyl-8-ribityllumazine synthase